MESLESCRSEIAGSGLGPKSYANTFIKILILLITFERRNGPLIAAGFSYRASLLSSPWIWNTNHNNYNVDVVGKGRRTALHESRINHEYYQSAAIDSRIVACGDRKFS